MIPTDREQQIMRLLDAGVPLRKRAGTNGCGLLDVSRIPATVLGQTMNRMLRQQWIAWDVERNSYALTEHGREHVALRTRVRDFAKQAEK